VVQEPVRDTRLLGDVADPRTVVAAPCEDPNGRVQQDLSLVFDGD
jgi:hypothetical protein